LKKLFLTIFTVSFLALMLAFLPLSPISVQALDRPELVSPIGSATGDSVLFEWDYSGSVDEFRLEVWDDDYLIFKEYLNENICDEGSADYGIEIDVGPGSNEIDLYPGTLYTWKVRAYEDSSSSSWSHSEDFWYETYLGLPAITISPMTGDSGDYVTIRGFGWEDGEDVEIYVDREKEKTLRNVDIDWDTRVRISGYGAVDIRAWGEESGWSNYAWFLIKGPDVELSVSGPAQVGDTVKISGSNWPNETVTVSFRGFYIDSFSSRGDWNLSFKVPASPAGEWPVTAWSRSATAEDYLEIVPSVTLSPESTGPGQPILAQGQGFASQSQIRISLDTSTFYSSTDILGNFSKEITSPSKSGNFVVQARDSKGNMATEELSVGGILNVSPPVLNIGQTLTIGGASFTPNRTIEITCDNRDLISVESDSDGNFEVKVKPELSAGKHTITASDRKISASATFEVESKAPDVPALQSPFNDKTLLGSKVTLTWLSVFDPSGVIYEVRVSKDESFSEIVGMATTSNTRAAIILPSGGTYYWQVRAVDNAGNEGNWSNVNSFNSQPIWSIVIGIVGGLIAASAGYLIWRKKPWITGSK
jgi:hypothetical protein